jgi:peptide/nickel transport system substrate-binding protein
VAPRREAAVVRGRRAAAFLAAAVALGGATGCGGGGEARETPASAAEPTPGGTCVVGLFSDFDSLNEFVSTDANATDCMENLLYLPLLRWSADIELEGALARSWDFSEDGRTITMQLRDDVRWHDGVPTTAEDVVFSFDRFRDPALAYADIGDLRRLESVEAVGPYAVRFRFTQPYANQLSDLRRVILPKHLLENVPSAEMESAAFNTAPVGNGPFRFVRWRRNQELVLEANPDFPDGRPYLDRIVLRVIPDQTAIETALRSGELDFVDRLRFETVSDFRRDPAFRVYTYPQRGYQYVGWNTRTPFFDTANERLAMTLAIDRRSILDALVFGEGKVTAHPVMSLSPFYASDIAPHPYDPDRARELLAAAGWKDTDGDGWLDQDGRKFEFTLVTNLGNQLREDTLVIIQDQLKRIGISVIPGVREWSVFLDDLKSKRFEACHLSWQTDFTVDPYDLFHSDAVEGKYNFTAFSNPRVDELIDAGSAARTAEEASPFWHELQAVLHEQQPYTILFELDYSVGTSARLRGVDIDVRGIFVGAREWWIAPADRKYAG